MKAGAGREALRIETQRLRDELSDLKIEAEITQGKLRRAEGLSERRPMKPTPLGPGLARPQSPISEASPQQQLRHRRLQHPPAKSASSTVSDAAFTSYFRTLCNSCNHHSTATSAKADCLWPVRVYTTPIASLSKAARHSRGPSIPISNGHCSVRASPHPCSARWTTSAWDPTFRLTLSDPWLDWQDAEAGAARTLGSIEVASTYQYASTSISKEWICSGQSYIPATVTMRSQKKRTGEAMPALLHLPSDNGDTTPLSTQHVSRLSFGAPPATPTPDRNGNSRPSSRASVSSSISQSGTSNHFVPSTGRPSSRQVSQAQGHRLAITQQHHQRKQTTAVISRW
jgi:hypothetical protein